jgi:hypothetical protein
MTFERVPGQSRRIASVDDTEAGYSDLKILVLIDGMSVSGLNAGVPAKCQISRSQLRFGSNTTIHDSLVGCGCRPVLMAVDGPNSS